MSSSFYRSQHRGLRNTNRSIMGGMPKNMASIGMNAPKKKKPFNPKDYEQVNLKEREIMIYKEIFDLFDTNKSEFLPPKELWQGLKLSGLNVNRETTYKVISECNFKDVSKITFRDFLKLCTDSRPCDKDQESEYYGYNLE